MRLSMIRMHFIRQSRNVKKNAYLFTFIYLIKNCQEINGDVDFISEHCNNTIIHCYYHTMTLIPLFSKAFWTHFKVENFSEIILSNLFLQESM